MAHRTAQLIVVNGPPGVGKSALARRFVEQRPLALLVEIDALRTSLGAWATHPESMALARDLALALVETHLRSGHDVVLPQFLGRTGLLDALDDLVGRVGAGLVEVALVDRPAAVVDRFRERRARLAATGEAHPQCAVDDAEIERFVASAFEQVAEVSRSRPGTVTIDAGSLEDAIRAIVRVAGPPSG